MTTLSDDTWFGDRSPPMGAEHDPPTNQEKKAMADSYFELRAEAGDQKLEVTSVEAAKAVAKSVREITGESVELYKVSPVDIDAPARTRGGS